MQTPATTFDADIFANQAKASVDNIPTAIGANTTLTLALVGVLLPETISAWVFAWLALSLGVSLLRVVHYRRIRAAGLERYTATRVLRELKLLSLVAGGVWGIVPLIETNAVGASTLAFTTFIVVGATTAAMTQTLSFAPTSLAFLFMALPPTAVALFLTGHWAAFIIGADILLLMSMMSKQAVQNAESFRENERLRLTAEAMASSLAVANERTVAANARLSELASHDVLTSLSNRAAFNDQLEMQVRRAAAIDGELALAIIDLDNFKVINDTQGHAAGDEVLREVAERFARLCRPDQFIARLGGDEFAILVPGPDALAVATALATSFVVRVGEPFVIDGRPSVIGASVGLALYPLHTRSPKELMASADIALYDAKQRGKNRVALFDNALKLSLERRRRIEGDLGRAIDAGALDVVFQPQVDLASGRTLGHEALVRWTHPELGPIAPPEIVTAAQNIYADARLTAYVLEHAFDFLDALTERGDRVSVVAVNVSPVEFRHASPAETFLAGIARRGVDPGRVEIEITEEAILDFSVAEADLMRLAAAGVRIAIDDFGAGYFSLASVSTLPLDRVKIDRSFITGIDDNPRHQLVVGNILALARKLGVSALAEGVETEAEAWTLRRLGCSEGQGFLFCRPVDAATALDRFGGDQAVANG